jgi:hypothetical protein
VTSRRSLSNDMSTCFVQEYVGEQRVLSSVNYVKFACEQFDSSNDVDVGYCFKYVTVSTDGAVIEQASQCISASHSGIAVEPSFIQTVMHGGSFPQNTEFCTKNQRLKDVFSDPLPSTLQHYTNFPQTLRLYNFVKFTLLSCECNLTNVRV